MYLPSEISCRTSKFTNQNFWCPLTFLSESPRVWLQNFWPLLFFLQQHVVSIFHLFSFFINFNVNTFFYQHKKGHKNIFLLLINFFKDKTLFKQVLFLSFLCCTFQYGCNSNLGFNFTCNPIHKYVLPPPNDCNSVGHLLSALLLLSYID